MRRALTTFALMAVLASGAASADDTPPPPSPRTGGSPDSVAGDLLIDGVYSYIGSTGPAAPDLFYFMGGAVLIHDNLGPTPLRLTMAADMVVVGAYDNYAMQHGVPQGRIFFTNLLALAPMFIVSYRYSHGDYPADRSGAYLVPLPRGGAMVGYHWSY